MPKFFVVFTEESTKDHGYYVDAENEEEAYRLAEDKYFNFTDADVISTGYSKTLGYEVKEEA
jgi:hypothetical protein